ncbi:hypothetical protein GCM10023321_72190 [Pseudonocardia eucalypti]|uniref:Uncharacterized protein n=1 Tax=Pseudonocardia eucalypti TaxID=648755 RepID=A0ABP9R6Z7_9PSEU|nr:hypothetical protein [Pseudonocardia eucalypti]
MSANVTELPVMSPGERRRAVVGTSLGNAIEWYDWNIYAVFSTVFAPVFFPDATGASGLIQVLLIFAVTVLLSTGRLRGFAGTRTGSAFDLLICRLARARRCNR